MGLFDGLKKMFDKKSSAPALEYRGETDAEGLLQPIRQTKRLFEATQNGPKIKTATFHDEINDTYEYYFLSYVDGVRCDVKKQIYKIENDQAVVVGDVQNVKSNLPFLKAIEELRNYEADGFKTRVESCVHEPNGVYYGDFLVGEFIVAERQSQPPAFVRDGEILGVGLFTEGDLRRAASMRGLPYQPQDALVEELAEYIKTLVSWYENPKDFSHLTDDKIDLLRFHETITEIQKKFLSITENLNDIQDAIIRIRNNPSSYERTNFYHTVLQKIEDAKKGLFEVVEIYNPKSESYSKPLIDLLDNIIGKDVFRILQLYSAFLATTQAKVVADAITEDKEHLCWDVWIEGFSARDERHFSSKEEAAISVMKCLAEARNIAKIGGAAPWIYDVLAAYAVDPATPMSVPRSMTELGYKIGDRAHGMKTTLLEAQRQKRVDVLLASYPPADAGKEGNNIVGYSPAYVQLDSETGQDYLCYAVVTKDATGGENVSLVQLSMQTPKADKDGIIKIRNTSVTKQEVKIPHAHARELLHVFDGYLKNHGIGGEKVTSLPDTGKMPELERPVVTSALYSNLNRAYLGLGILIPTDDEKCQMGILQLPALPLRKVTKTDDPQQDTKFIAHGLVERSIAEGVGRMALVCDLLDDRLAKGESKWWPTDLDQAQVGKPLIDYVNDKGLNLEAATQLAKIEIAKDKRVNAAMDKAAQNKAIPR